MRRQFIVLPSQTQWDYDNVNSSYKIACHYHTAEIVCTKTIVYSSFRPGAHLEWRRPTNESLPQSNINKTN